MKIKLISFIGGSLFSFGLIYSEMTKPVRVIGFLDIFGNWDPTLLFVMGGAILVHMTLYPIIRKRRAPVLNTDWSIPQKKTITKSLLIGSFLFGMGWGIGGYCPGPGITAMTSLHIRPILFTIFMILGMLVYKYTEKYLP